MTIATKPVVRETASYERNRALVVTVHPRHLELREKGTRRSVAVDYSTLYDFARKLEWRKAMEEKRLARKKR